MLTLPIAPARLVNDGKELTLAVFSCSQFQQGETINLIQRWFRVTRQPMDRLFQRVRVCDSQHFRRCVHPPRGLRKFGIPFLRTVNSKKSATDLRSFGKWVCV